MMKKSETLLLLESLAARMVTNTELQKQLSINMKGYLGEINYQTLLSDFFTLSDLYLEPKNGQRFQVDHLVCVAGFIFIYEVKNYSFEWEYNEEYFSRSEKLEIPNPLIQLTRTKHNFKQLLKEIGFGHIPVKAAVVFVHSEFTLFNAPRGKALILPTQIPEHIEYMKQFPKPTTEIIDAAEVIQKLALKPEVFRKNIPDYEYHDLKKGLRCVQCGSLDLIVNSKKYSCSDCLASEKVSLTIQIAAE